MEAQLLMLTTIAFATLSFTIHLLITLSTKPPTTPLPPPGPSLISILSTLATTFLRYHPTTSLLHRLHAAHGPVLTLRLPFLTTIYILISETDLAHRPLVKHGSTTNRFPPTASHHLQPLNYTTITLAPSGDSWRLLRRNLVSGILNPSSVKLFSAARRHARAALMDGLRSKVACGGVVRVGEMFARSSLGLFGVMCFGEEFGKEEVERVKVTMEREIAAVTQSLLFAYLPRVVQWGFSKSALASGVVESREERARVFLPLLRARQRVTEGKARNGTELVRCYADSLLDFEIAGRRLTEDEIIGLCSEFFGAGMHTTSIAMEWVMAELVNNPDVQESLAEELHLAMESEESFQQDEEEDILLKVPHLKAVIMESLRRHPPTAYLVRHSVKEDVEMGGYLLPKGAQLVFSTELMGLDAKEWIEPMEFRPERFLAGGDGGKRLMTFGAGRRMCPGMGLSMLHLSYFAAHLVREFRWSAAEGNRVDMTECVDETFVRMKKPLLARVSTRRSAMN